MEGVESNTVRESPLCWAHAVKFSQHIINWFLTLSETELPLYAPLPLTKQEWPRKQKHAASPKRWQPAGGYTFCNSNSQERVFFQATLTNTSCCQNVICIAREATDTPTTLNTLCLNWPLNLSSATRGLHLEPYTINILKYWLSITYVQKWYMHRNMYCRT